LVYVTARRYLFLPSQRPRLHQSVAAATPPDLSDCAKHLLDSTNVGEPRKPI